MALYFMCKELFLIDFCPMWSVEDSIGLFIFLTLKIWLL